MTSDLNLNKRSLYLIAVGILLSIMIIAPGSAAQTDNTVLISDIVLDPGDNITIPIMILDSTGVASAGIKLSYDPCIVIVTDVMQGDITSFFGFDDSNAGKGWITINAFMLGTQLTGDILFANVTLEAVGSSGECLLGLEILALSNKNASDISGQVENGNFQIRGYTSETISNGDSSSSSSSSRGTTAEAFENIELTESDSEYISNNEEVSFVFIEPGNVITYLNFTSVTNAGQITSVIEVLKGTSGLTDRPPDDKVYRNFNAWVGNYGYATKEHIIDCVIGFRVSKQWVNEKQIDAGSIRLTRYYMDIWNDLITNKVGEDDEYLYFKGDTSGFSSPFAIIGSSIDEVALYQDKKIEDYESAMTSDIPVEIDAGERTAPGFGFFIGIGCMLVILCLKWIRRNTD